jgi:hypothetical protein
MSQSRVRKVDLPAGTLVAQAFPRLDYADCYCVPLPAGAPNDLDAMARVALGGTPHWITLLMRLRDQIVGPFGLKTSTQVARRTGNNGRLQIGDQLGIFKVFDRTDNELLLGEDDRHLDFRLSVLVRNATDTDWAFVSTVVRFNNFIGRMYFLPVRQFHKLIVPAMMRNAYRHYATLSD